MNNHVTLNLVDLGVFALYMLVTIALGFWVARKGRDTAQGYFLGNKTIPWFVIGSSMVAADFMCDVRCARCDVPNFARRTSRVAHFAFG